MVKRVHVVLIRHGEAVWNIQRRRIGQLDCPLTARGVAQAEALAKRLASSRFDALYSSDLGRAQATAACVAKALNLEPRLHEGLRERNLGVFQGLAKGDISARYPEEVLRHQRLGFEDTILNGESEVQLRKRAMHVMMELVRKPAEQNIVAITHGGFLRAFFSEVFDLPMKASASFARPHTAYNAFEFDGARWILRAWGDISHVDRR